MEDTNGRPSLLDHEWIALAALARLLVRSDGQLSFEEVSAVGEVFGSFPLETSAESTPYRVAPPRAEMTPEAIGAWLERAARELHDGAAVRSAALGVKRPVAREGIYAALFELAASDVVAQQEWPLLDWLRDAWDLGADGLTQGPAGDAVEQRAPLSARVVRVEREGVDRERVVLTLTRDSGVRASFRSERWTDAAVKLLRPELQTGDPSFDDRVYVATETPDATLALLASARVRIALAELVATGGAVEIDADTVRAPLPEDVELDDDTRLIRIVVALSRS